MYYYIKWIYDSLSSLANLIQNGKVIGTAKFNLTLVINQQLIVSSYPENQYAEYTIQIKHSLMLVN
jgi:hypothetical protein